MASPEALATTLLAVTPREYVRFLADWLPSASSLTQAPPLTRVPVVDALAAAAAEHAARVRGLPVPAWTQRADRFLDQDWWGSRIVPSRADQVLLLRLPPAAVPRKWRGRYARAWLHRHCLATTPLSFRRHALIIENDSLTSI